MKVLFIDNLDFFTYSLVDEFEKKGCETLVHRNDTEPKFLDAAIKKFRPGLIVLLSGPGNPEHGNAARIVGDYTGKIPIFGVGLGCLCIIAAFGGKSGKSPFPVHGKSSKIFHDGKGIFKKLENPLTGARYNSLVAVDVPYSLEVSARDSNDVVMGIRHKESPVEGVMFHPESLLTLSGSALIDNVMSEAGKK